MKIQHVVAWRLKDSALGNDKATNARLLKEKLEALPGQIPGLRRITTKKTPNRQRLGFSCVVELAGVEPASEGTPSPALHA